MKMKISEYAKLKGVTYRTIWNWIKKGYVVVEKSKSGINYIVLDKTDLTDLSTPTYTAKTVEELERMGGVYE